jgi:hypothetical protein
MYRRDERFDYEQSVPIEDLIDLSRTHPREAFKLFELIRERAADRASDRCEWMQLLDRDEQLWHGAVLYLGQGALDARLA